MRMAVPPIEGTNLNEREDGVQGAVAQTVRSTASSAWNAASSSAGIE